MRLLGKVILCFAAINLIYKATLIVNGLIKTIKFKPDMDSYWNKVDTLNNTVVFKKN